MSSIGDKPDGRVCVVPSRLAAGMRTDLRLTVSPDRELPPGSRLWLFYDIRQSAGNVRAGSGGADGSVRAELSDGAEIELRARGLRTLDLYPAVPEFLHCVEVRTGSRPLPAGVKLHLVFRDWPAPLRPIRTFHFWLIPDWRAQWELEPTGYKTYHRFVERGTGRRVPHEELVAEMRTAAVAVEGAEKPVPAASRRRTPGVFWGELHGMAFNQRPLDEFYEYAKTVSRLDFACACLFSYNTCVDGVWERVKDAAARHTVPGEFVALTGFECGTPPDDSHRCAYFPRPAAVPPIFGDSRPPAQDPALRKRFHPDTVVCETLEDYYAAVARFGGLTAGHFHTTTYDREPLAEIWQKQNIDQVSGNEEERLYELLRQGKRFGLVGGSDTHDSMPGNPEPEPGCPNSAGTTGVWADELSPAGLWEALLARRVFATTGPRIAVDFSANGCPMGSELSAQGPRRFRVDVDAPGELAAVELLRNGHVLQEWSTSSTSFHVACEDTLTHPAFYHVRACQADGHRAWSSPIWLGAVGEEAPAGVRKAGGPPTP